MDELYPGDPNYPALLGAIPSPPTLYVRGAVTMDDALALAIVGARDATPYGVEVAERLAGELGARGVTIVSGLARGIDAAAHRGALDAGGRTPATSAGTNRLIQDGAKLITCWQDVVSELPEPWRRMVRASSTTTQGSPRPDGQSDEGRVLAMLTPDEPQHIEQLIAGGGLEPSRVAAALVALELGGWAQQLTGQRWVSVGARARRT